MRIRRYVPLVIFSISLFLLLILVGYSQEWTGLPGYYDSQGQFQRAKTLWDWMELLIVPVVLAAGGLIFNWSVRKNEREISVDQTLEVSLRTFIDEMTMLILDRGLRKSRDDDEVRTLARVRTLTTIRTLDSRRNCILIDFLRESRLLSPYGQAVNLGASDLSGANLNGVNLAGVYLRQVNLSKANLFSANLIGADLSEANLHGAKLQSADLHGANLARSYLVECDFLGADLRVADLTGANLRRADLRKADLERANMAMSIINDAKMEGANLQAVVMPDGKKHK